MTPEQRLALNDLRNAVRNNVISVPKETDSAIDVHFFAVIQTPGSFVTADRLRTLLANAEAGEFGSMPKARWAEGPSYIEIGGWIGDQGEALMLMGLGGALGIFDVITPATLGIVGEDADRMAGGGFVMAQLRPAA